MAFRMFHPEIEVTAECPSEEAFFQAWEHLGWRRLGAAEAYAADILGRSVRDVREDVTVDELKRLTRSRGYAPAKGNKKDDHLAAFTSTFGDSPKTDYVVPDEEPTPGFVPNANDPAASYDGLPDSSALPTDPQES